MGQFRKGKANFMNEMRQLIYEINDMKPEPEVCNVSCPPLGCPLGPCPGLCCHKGVCDPCCVSKMPKSPIPTCPARSYPAYTYPPPSCSFSSASANSQSPGNYMMSSQLIGSPHSQSRNFSHPPTTFVPRREYSNRLSSIPVCQVPSTKPVHTSHRSYCPAPLYQPQHSSTPQACSSVIEVCYPEIIPMSLPPQAKSSKRSSQRHRTISCPPDALAYSESRQQSCRPGRLPSRQACPPNSPYIVTIPYRKMY